MSEYDEIEKSAREYEAIVADLIAAVRLLRNPNWHSDGQLATADSAISRAFEAKREWRSFPKSN